MDVQSPSFVVVVRQDIGLGHPLGISDCYELFSFRQTRYLEGMHDTFDDFESYHRLHRERARKTSSLHVVCYSE